MWSVGNFRADQIYGSEKVAPHALKELKQQFVVAKYVQLLFAPHVGTRPPTTGAVSASSDAVDAIQAQNNRSSREPAPANTILSVPRPTVQVVRRTVAMPSSRDTQGGCPPISAQVAQKVDIPDSFFEDLFGEVAETPRQPQAVQHVISTHDSDHPSTAKVSVAAHALDAFLWDNLCVF